jgi:hypothetical protein
VLNCGYSGVSGTKILTKLNTVIWSCVVKPNGILPRAGMLMSKGMMANIWSWDHTFNALTGKGLRDRAYTWTSSVFMILAHEFSL